MEDMARYCNNLVVMHDGQIKMQGSAESVFSQAEVLYEIGLDIPQITRLVGILRKKGMEIPENIYTVDSAFEILREYYKKASKGNQK